MITLVSLYVQFLNPLDLYPRKIRPLRACEVVLVPLHGVEVFPLLLLLLRRLQEPLDPVCLLRPAAPLRLCIRRAGGGAGDGAGGGARRGSGGCGG